MGTAESSLTVQEVRQKAQHVDVGHRIQHCNPTDQELAHLRTQHVHTLAQKGDKLLYTELVALSHNVLSTNHLPRSDDCCPIARHPPHLYEAVQQVRRLLHVKVGVCRQLAEGVEHIVEEDDEVPPGDLGNVIERLACVVAHPAVLVREGTQDRGDNALPNQAATRECAHRQEVV